MIPQKEDIGRQVKEKNLPFKKIKKPEQVNPLIALYYWWESHPEKYLLLFCGGLFAMIFCIGHYFFNPYFEFNPEFLSLAPISVFSFIFSLEFFSYFFFMMILFLFVSLFGATPVIPFSILLNLRRIRKDTHKSFSQIAYAVTFLYFPCLRLYRWVIFCLSDGYYIPFTMLIGSLILAVDTLFFLSAPHVCVMVIYNRLFGGVGKKMTNFFGK